MSDILQLPVTGDEINTAIEQWQRLVAGLLKGNKNYHGTAITSAGTYELDIEGIIPNDFYWNVDTGAVYYCTAVDSSSTTWAFLHNFTGAAGANGASIQTISRTSGTGAAGELDTYTVTLTNGNTTSFQVRNGANGATGATGASAFELALQNGFEGSLDEWFESLKVKGDDGDSAYQVWLDTGNLGTVNDFLASLVGATGATGAAGADGKSTYDIWKENGHPNGTAAEFLEAMKGTVEDIVWSAITNTPTTLQGYGITDAFINPTAHTVKLGANTIAIPTTAADVDALPEDTEIPSKTSDLTNDSGFITDYTETDPTVPPWAKQPNKPSYTASEVGAMAANAVFGILDILGLDSALGGLQSQIDGIEAAANVADVTSTHAGLVAYDTSTLTADDIIKVLADETHDGAATYYRWVITNSVGEWDYIGTDGEYYTKGQTYNRTEINSFLATLQEKINVTGLLKRDANGDIVQAVEGTDYSKFSGNYNDLSNKPSPYTLPTATASVLGGIKAGNGLVISSDGTAAVVPRISTFANGDTITLAAEEREYYSTVPISSLTIAPPASGRYLAHFEFATASSGNISINLPANALYANGEKPVYGNGETWEISIKNGKVSANKFGGVA